MQTLKLGIDVDSSEALAKLEALTEAAQKAEAALRAFNVAYKAIGNAPVILNVAEQIRDHNLRRG